MFDEILPRIVVLSKIVRIVAQFSNQSLRRRSVGHFQNRHDRGTHSLQHIRFHQCPFCSAVVPRVSEQMVAGTAAPHVRLRPNHRMSRSWTHVGQVSLGNLLCARRSVRTAHTRETPNRAWFSSFLCSFIRF